LKSSPYVPNSVLEGEKFILLPDDNGPLSKSVIDISGHRKGGFHDVPIFTSQSVPSWPAHKGHYHMGSQQRLSDFHSQLSTGGGRGGDSKVILHHHHLPSPPPDFEGREVDMHRVITTLLSRRLVTLVGDLGMGKSALSSSVCAYCADRRMYEDGVLYLRSTNVKLHKDFLFNLQICLLQGPYKISNIFKEINETIMFGQQPPNKPLDMNQQEDLIIACLGSMKVLLVFDDIDGIIEDPEEADDMKMFLFRLFERCSYIKVLITSIDTLDARKMNGLGIVENSVNLGPLTILSSLRLFSRLAPTLAPASSKISFIRCLLPPKQGHVTANSREITSATSQILAKFGNGHPAKIVKMACESSNDSIEKLKAFGCKIISEIGSVRTRQNSGNENNIKGLVRSRNNSASGDSVGGGDNPPLSGIGAAIAAAALNSQTDIEK
jgi:ABC-type enterochelin transport system ATPase subunit